MKVAQAAFLYFRGVFRVAVRDVDAGGDWCNGCGELRWGDVCSVKQNKKTTAGKALSVAY